MNKKYLLISGLLVLVLSGVYLYSRSRTETTINRTYPESSNFSFYTIHDLKEYNPSTGTFNTEGYVVKKYKCPPCPYGVACKPCMEENIVVSETNKTLESYSLTGTDMIIFTENVDQFNLGSKYNFSVRVRDSKSTSEPISDIELVGYSSL